jgi:hypothetical protein
MRGAMGTALPAFLFPAIVAAGAPHAAIPVARWLATPHLPERRGARFFGPGTSIMHHARGWLQGGAKPAGASTDSRSREDGRSGVLAAMAGCKFVMTAGPPSTRHQRARIRQLRGTQLSGASVGVDGGERGLPGVEGPERRVIGIPCDRHAGSTATNPRSLATAVDSDRRELRALIGFEGGPISREFSGVQSALFDRPRSRLPARRGFVVGDPVAAHLGRICPDNSPTAVELRRCLCEMCPILLNNRWADWQDLNLRPPRPERGALPDCATLRCRWWPVL